MKGTWFMQSTKCAVTTKRDYLARIWQWLTALGRSHPSRQLRLQETLALGERRFLAVIEFERQKFLIAGTGNSVAMLTPLPMEWSANTTRRPKPRMKKSPPGNSPAAGQAANWFAGEARETMKRGER